MVIRRVDVNEAALRRYLRKHAEKKVFLTLTDDKKAIMKASYSEKDRVNLTLHGMFLDAPSNVLRALARFLKKPDPKMKRNVARLFFKSGLDITKKAKHKKPALLTHQGKCFNLKDIYDKINQKYFKNRVKAFITWGSEDSRRRSCSINFGSYNWDSRIIRVHKALDRYFIPRYFIEYIIYHEMLHAHIGMKRDGKGRSRAHNREFKKREKDFLHYKRAVEWEKKNLGRFINEKEY